MNAKQTITDKINKSPLESKKWIIGLMTLGSVLLVYVASLISIVMMNGKSSGDIVGLANITIVFIGTFMSIVFTGTSAVDWKAISSLENIQKTEIQNQSSDTNVNVNVNENKTITETQNINLKEFERQEGVNAPDSKPFGQMAIDE